MTTIAYDRPVKDLISQLNATGHVTHTTYRKTSVTLHHNAGRLSHEGVLKVWQSRPASAQFDADAVGAIAQYVKVNEYAWAAGNTVGNMRSIHIEMANSTLSPAWTVADATWKSAARLSGWLFAKVIGERPNSSNFFVHKHWYQTACAGPYIDIVWNPIMIEAQRAYDFFKATPVKPVDGPQGPFPLLKGRGYAIGSRGWGVNEIQMLLREISPGIVVDGQYGPVTANLVGIWTKRFGPYTTKVVNKQVWDFMTHH